MRYATAHKAKTRRRIIETAAQRFRQDGIEAVGVASLMGGAGLTHGGFYSHFRSKEVLVAQALGFAMKETFERLRQASEAGGLAAVIRYYLRPAHREQPGRGCAAAALGAETARHPKSTRAVLAGEIEKLVHFIAGHLPSKDVEIAWAIFATLVGTIQMARVVSKPKLSDSILKAGEAAALQLAGLAA
ncbi:MAG: TetR/AcrR family transcriptional regulator [Chthoniobacter sp.]|nr:TetR/AcrR family transcriptional regulator [Chthoniobacter sp.]